MNKSVNLFANLNAAGSEGVTVFSSTPWRAVFIHLLVIFTEFILIGWLMSGLNASFLICSGTLAVCAYLIWVGPGGIALAAMWVVGLMSVAAVNQLWFHGLPRPVFSYIPMMLFLDWLFALAAVWHLGKASAFIKTAAGTTVSVQAGLFGLAAAGIHLGWRLYPYTTAYLKAWLL